MKRNFKTLKINPIFFLLMFSFMLFTACKREEATADYTTIKTQGEMQAELTAPPLVPKPIGNRAAMKLKVNVEIKEQEGTMADGVKYTYWTFGGSVPGSFIRTRVAMK